MNQHANIKVIQNSDGTFTAVCGAWILARRGAGIGAKSRIISDDAPGYMLDAAERALDFVCSAMLNASTRGNNFLSRAEIATAVAASAAR